MWPVRSHKCLRSLFIPPAPPFLTFLSGGTLFSPPCAPHRLAPGHAPALAAAVHLLSSLAHPTVAPLPSTLRPLAQAPFYHAVPAPGGGPTPAASTGAAPTPPCPLLDQLRAAVAAVLLDPDGAGSGGGEGNECPHAGSATGCGTGADDVFTAAAVTSGSPPPPSPSSLPSSQLVAGLVALAAGCLAVAPPPHVGAAPCSALAAAAASPSATSAPHCAASHGFVASSHVLLALARLFASCAAASTPCHHMLALAFASPFPRWAATPAPSPATALPAHTSGGSALGLAQVAALNRDARAPHASPLADAAATRPLMGGALPPGLLATCAPVASQGSTSAPCRFSLAEAVLYFVALLRPHLAPPCTIASAYPPVAYAGAAASVPLCHAAAHALAQFSQLSIALYEMLATLLVPSPVPTFAGPSLVPASLAALASRAGVSTPTTATSPTGPDSGSSVLAAVLRHRMTCPAAAAAAAPAGTHTTGTPAASSVSHPSFHLRFATHYEGHRAALRLLRQQPALDAIASATAPAASATAGAPVPAPAPACICATASGAGLHALPTVGCPCALPPAPPPPPPGRSPGRAAAAATPGPTAVSAARHAAHEVDVCAGEVAALWSFCAAMCAWWAIPARAVVAGEEASGIGGVWRVDSDILAGLPPTGDGGGGGLNALIRDIGAIMRSPHTMV